MPAGGSKRMIPDDKNVCSSVGCQCWVSVRVSPLGYVTVNVGAKPWPCR